MSGEGILFKKSDKKCKEYTSILPNGSEIHFGDIRYQQYKDKTPLKLYSYLDHNTPKRRELYYKRHLEDG